MTIATNIADDGKQMAISLHHKLKIKSVKSIKNISICSSQTYRGDKKLYNSQSVIKDPILRSVLDASLNLNIQLKLTKHVKLYPQQKRLNVLVHCFFPNMD